MGVYEIEGPGEIDSGPSLRSGAYSYNVIWERPGVGTFELDPLIFIFDRVFARGNQELPGAASRRHINPRRSIGPGGDQARPGPMRMGPSRLGGGALVVDDRAVVNVNHARGLAGDRRVVADHDDRLARGVQLLEQPDDALARGRVQVARGLVREHDRRSFDQRAGDGHALHLSAGELRGLVLQAVGEADALSMRSARSRRARAPTPAKSSGSSTFSSAEA